MDITDDFDIDDFDNFEEFNLEDHFKAKEKQQQKNEELLENFKKWLQAKGLTDKTVAKHVDNMDFYINDYLTYYEIKAPGEDLLEIHAFLNDWFIRKTMWASKTAIKDYCAGFKKFYKFMVEKNMVSENDYEELRIMIKECKSDWLTI